VNGLNRATLSKVSNQLVFNNTGNYLVSHTQYKDFKSTLTIPSYDKEVGIICGYLTDTYQMKAVISRNGYLYIFGTFEEKEKLFFEGNISAETYPLSIQITKELHHYECYLNGEKATEWDYIGFTSSYLGIYGEEGAVVNSFLIDEKQSAYWDNNVSSNTRSKIVEGANESYYYMEGMEGFPVCLHQPITLEPGNHTLSFRGIGKGTVRINGTNYPFTLTDFYVKADLMNVTTYQYDGTEISSFYPEDTGHEALGELGDLVKETSISISIPSGGNYVLDFEATTPLLVTSPQVEQANLTPYIPTTDAIKTRQASVLAYPIQSLTDRGSVYVQFSLTKQEGANHIVEDSESNFVIAYDKTNVNGEIQTNVYFTLFNTTIDLPVTDVNNIKAFVSWSNQAIRFGVNDTYQEVSTTVTGHLGEKMTFLSVSEPITLVEWALWPDYHTELPSLESASAHYTFSYGVGGKNATYVEMPLAPFDHSPILVEKENQDIMTKVSFFDPETGLYRTYHEEFTIYDGKADFLPLTFQNIDENGFYLQVLSEDTLIGEPYRLDEKRLYLTLSSVEKDFYFGKRLTIRYQVKDSYTVDYNINALDGYRLNFAKQTDEHKKVYQEAMRFQEPIKLATMIEMNPLYNHHHDGFMYIVDEVHPTETFFVTMTPNQLVANGLSQATILIEPKDKEGNPVVMAMLDVSATHGYIYPDFSRQSLENQKRTGQYVYKFHVPYLAKGIEKDVTKVNLHIKDVEANIGVLKPLYLHSSEKSYQDYQSSSIFLLLEAKGKIAQTILRYEGLQSYQDAELHSMLDLNNDGLVNLDDLVILETGERDREMVNLYHILKEKGVVL
jgi:hypothetical protein